MAVLFSACGNAIVARCSSNNGNLRDLSRADRQLTSNHRDRRAVTTLCHNHVHSFSELYRSTFNIIAPAMIRQPNDRKSNCPNKITKCAIKICSFSPHDSERRTRAQSKVAYYPPRSENHQKVTPEQRKNFETCCTRHAHIKQYRTN